MKIVSWFGNWGTIHTYTSTKMTLTIAYCGVWRTSNYHGTFLNSYDLEGYPKIKFIFKKSLMFCNFKIILNYSKKKK
jgi:hypothetical protein